jgi:hypothetical protein
MLMMVLELGLRGKAASSYRKSDSREFRSKHISFSSFVCDRHLVTGETVSIERKLPIRLSSELGLDADVVMYQGKPYINIVLWRFPGNP